MNYKLRRLTNQFIAAFAIPSILLLIGCGYGDVSPLASNYAKSIYSTSNVQKTENLSKIRDKIVQSVDSGKLPADEADLLYDMLDKAEAGNWDSAMKDSRALMEAQIKK